MYRQQLKNPPLSTIAGIGAVVLLVAALLLDSMLANLLARYIGGTGAKILFWLTGALIALIALKRYVLQYEYELANGMLSLNFRYGRYVRSVDSFALRTLVAVGTPEEILPRYKGAPVHRAVLKRNALAQTAIAYKYEGKIELCVFQPDDEIREALMNQVKKK